MTHERFFRPVISIGHTAVVAGGDIPTIGTHQRRRESSPIKEEYHLFSPLQPGSDSLDQVLREYPRFLLAGRLEPHINDTHQRHLAVISAFRKYAQLVLARLRVIPRLERRGRRAKEHCALLDISPHNRHISGTVAWNILLLIAILVLLIHDDQAKILHRSKDC